MPAHEGNAKAVRVGVGVLAVLVLLYSFLITQRLLLGVSLVVWLFGAYLAWQFFLLAGRFVRAVERIADATERDRGDTRTQASRPSERERVQE